MQRFIDRTGAAVAALAMAALASPSAHASDYSHNCISTDGLYESNDGTLYARDDVTRTEIPYNRVGEERLLAERSGYCLAKGNRYDFQHKTYTMDVRITVKDQPRDIRLECELASDGLPAALSCDKEVITVRKQPDYANPSNVSPPAPSANLWLHNGSKLKLEASGKARRFVYVEPRRGMVEAGARPGAVVFEGERAGNAYSGTAYLYSAQCGRKGYDVAGTVGEDDRVVRLTGNAPLLDIETCAVTGSKVDVLVFTFVDK